MKRILMILAIGLLAAGGAWLWYANLDQSHKRFVDNLMQQARFLPARYQV
jgi:hypothetical protein